MYIYIHVYMYMYMYLGSVFPVMSPSIQSHKSARGPRKFNISRRAARTSVRAEAPGDVSSVNWINWINWVHHHICRCTITVTNNFVL